MRNNNNIFIYIYNGKYDKKKKKDDQMYHGGQTAIQIFTVNRQSVFPQQYDTCIEDLKYPVNN